MYRHLYRLLLILPFLPLSIRAQGDEYSISYLNDQAEALFSIQEQLEANNLLALGMPVESPDNKFAQKSYSLLKSFEKWKTNPSSHLNEELDTKLRASHSLVIKLKEIQAQEKIAFEELQIASLYFHDLSILSQELYHSLNTGSYSNSLAPSNLKIHAEAIQYARKLVLAYRYEQEKEISLYKRKLRSFKFQPAKASASFSQDFRQLLLSRIDKEEAYNQKVLKVFNLWVEVYNEWRKKQAWSLSPQIKLGPEFRPIKASQISLAPKKEPQDLIFLLDVSGSMNKTEKLPLIKRSLLEVLPYLNSEDRISVLTFADESQQILSNYSPKQETGIAEALEKIKLGGKTRPYSSLHTAYQIARNNIRRDRPTRIILLTDGGFKIDPEKLPKLIEAQSYEGVSLSIMYTGSNEAEVRNRLRKLTGIGKGHYLALGRKNPAQHLLQLIQQLHPLPLR
ncbi:MAG: VWA domain-containing protein [Bacteroidia bacterium]|nr:VWA domain-containing protein [Bacteroidia bacterium]